MQPLAEGSTLLARVREAADDLDRALSGSRLHAVGRRFIERVQTATTSSGLMSSMWTLERWARAAWLFEWLTKEPEPDVVVIDLREVKTVAPVLSALEGFVDRLAPAWDTSTVGRLGRMLDAAAESSEVLDNRVVDVLVRLLEPPEPPE